MSVEKTIHNHKYLLALYYRVNEFLGDESISHEKLPDIIVSFCTVVEKILKIKLYNVNPILVYDTSWPIQQQDSLLSVIALKKEKVKDTVKIDSVIKRVQIVCQDEFTSDELQVLVDIYRIRNCFVHGSKSDDEIEYNVDHVVRKMGTFWPKISKIAESLFGTDKIESAVPTKMYTKDELEQVLEDEVRKMIQPLNRRVGFDADMLDDSSIYAPMVYPYENKCPRCRSNAFSLRDENKTWGSLYNSLETAFTAVSEDRPNLYKCKKCNLELTEKQYEIAKRLRGGI